MRYRIVGLFALYGAMWIFALVCNNSEWFNDWPLQLGFPAFMIGLIACGGGAFVAIVAIICGKRAFL